ncbi:MAG: transposase [Salinibacter sp.]
MGQYRNVTTLNDIKITERIEKDWGIVFEAEWDPGKEAYEICPKNGCIDPELRRRGDCERKARDMRRNGQPVGIRLSLQRFECMNCEEIFCSDHEGIVDNKNLTQTLYDHILEKSLQPWTTFSELEDRFGFGKSTVGNLFDEHVEERDEDYSPEPPRVLGIDGVYVKTKGETWTVLANIEEETVIELVNAQTADSVERCVRRLGLRGETEVVVMDMSTTYRAAVENALPKASIVVDRWHIAGKAEEAMSAVKSEVADKELMEEWRERESELAGAEELPEGHQLTLGGVQRPITLQPDEDLLDRMEAAYRAKTEFERIFELRSRKKAARRFREWERSLPSSIQDEFEDVTRPLGNWRSQILNYFDHRFTNSLVENSAKVIGQIDDRTDGCDFSTMRGKVVFGPTHKTKTEARKRGPMLFEGIGLGNVQPPPGGQRQLGQEQRTID